MLIQRKKKKKTKKQNSGKQKSIDEEASRAIIKGFNIMKLKEDGKPAWTTRKA